jgi:hypothetical protein
MADWNPLALLGEAERTPLVKVLLARIEQLLEDQRRQAELVQQLRDEIAILKGERGKPKFKPSGMEQETETSNGDAGAGDGTGGPPERPGSAKRRKTAQITIHQTVKVNPGMELPAGSRFKGDRDLVVQDLRIAAHNTLEPPEVDDDNAPVRACVRYLSNRLNPLDISVVFDFSAEVMATTIWEGDARSSHARLHPPPQRS